MQESLKIIPICAEIYPAFYAMVQSTQWGNPMLPVDFNSRLWGDIIYRNNEIIGGWVGTIRGNIPVARIITKSVYFDSYPIFKTKTLEEQYLQIFMSNVKYHAEKDRVVMLNLTHWVRGAKNIDLDVHEKYATFLIDLQSETDVLWSALDSTKQRNIKKAIKNEVAFHTCKNEESLNYLNDFQQLREITQTRAISSHKHASILLKSNAFFSQMMQQDNVTLLLGKYKEHVGSVALVTQGGNVVYYHSGGSDIEINRKTCCSTYMFWQSFLYFKANGIKYFDMGGVPCDADETHPAYGVYRFKKSFGGKYMEFDGGKIIIAPFRYKLLQFLLSQRKLLRFFSTKL
jgi:lipid II:glycine glycyltransferase (peptidoglycan interpeptide bridge formation enzyme)